MMVQIQVLPLGHDLTPGESELSQPASTAEPKNPGNFCLIPAHTPVAVGIVKPALLRLLHDVSSTLLTKHSLAPRVGIQCVISLPAVWYNEAGAEHQLDQLLTIAHQKYK